MNKLEIKFWKFAQFLIKRGYGADCEISDLEDFPEDYKTPQDVFAQGRCGSCRAKETLNWIDYHIKLLK